MSTQFPAVGLENLTTSSPPYNGSSAISQEKNEGNFHSFPSKPGPLRDTHPEGKVSLPTKLPTGLFRCPLDFRVAGVAEVIGPFWALENKAVVGRNLPFAA
jgi:hypothetical protein